MTQAEIEMLKKRINGMSAEELKIVSETIPVELCFNRVGKELQTAMDTIKAAKTLFGEKSK